MENFLFKILELWFQLHGSCVFYLSSGDDFPTIWNFAAGAWTTTLVCLDDVLLLYPVLFCIMDSIFFMEFSNILKVIQSYIPVGSDINILVILKQRKRVKIWYYFSQQHI